MATVNKRTTKKPIPDGATITTYRDRRCAQWTDGEGKAQRAPLSDDGGSIIIESERYYAQWRDVRNKVRRQIGFTDKAATLQLAQKLEREARQRRLGLVDDSQHRLAEHAKAPISDHVDAFIASMQSKGRAPAHSGTTRAYLSETIEALSWQTLRDVRADGIESHLAGKHDEGLSNRSVNARLVAWRSFCRWCVQRGRLTIDPTASLKKRNERVDMPRPRKPLNDEELEKLIQVAQAGPTIAGVDGASRAMLYSVLAMCGLRLNEARTLTRRDVKLDDPDGPILVVRAENAKSRCRRVIPIPSALARRLAPWIDTRPKSGPLWKLPWKPVELLKRDLTTAHVAYVDPDGFHRDLHSLRHGFVSRLVKASVPIKTVQALAGHASATTTLGIYAHVGIVDERRAVEKAFGGDEKDPPEQVRLRATGTDGEMRTQCAHPIRFEAQTDAIHRNADAPESSEASDQKHLVFSGESNGSQRPSSPLIESGRLDLNQRPFDPQSNAKPICDSATPDSGDRAHPMRTSESKKCSENAGDPVSTPAVGKASQGADGVTVDNSQAVPSPDDDLATILDSWDRLNPAVKRSLAAIAQASVQG